MMPPTAMPGPLLFRGGTDEQVRTGDPMTQLQKIELVFRSYFKPSGRASRSEYWWFALFCVVVSIVLGGIEAAVNTGGILGTVFSLGIWIPSLMVGIRRLHDVGRSGWWLLLSLTIIGIFVVLFWAVQPGDPQPNRFNTPA